MLSFGIPCATTSSPQRGAACCILKWKPNTQDTQDTPGPLIQPLFTFTAQ
jgi:hypothetical protein